jgi:hypothetical protein
MTDLDEVGTLSDSATLLRHNTTKRSLPVARDGQRKTQGTA